jgi:lipopolysaccharide transport system ATP-binding protein
VVAHGPVDEVVQHYMTDGHHSPAEREWSPGEAPGDNVARLVAARVVNEASQTTQTTDIRQPVGIEFDYEVLTAGASLVPNIHLYNSDGICVFASNGWRKEAQPRARGRHRSTVWIPGNFLSEGTFSVAVALSTHEPIMVHFWSPDSLSFQVVDTLEGESARGPYAGPFAGVVRPLLPWQTVPVIETCAT